MTLWFILALMTLAASVAILWPLGRRPASKPSQEVAFYRQQLSEIERDLHQGLIAAPEADAARLEVSRRLLRAAEMDFDGLRSSPRHRRSMAIAGLLLLPLISAAIYLTIGAPDFAAQPPVRRDEAKAIVPLVAQIEEHLRQNPEDGKGWEVVAPVYLRLGRVDDAVKAREEAIRLLGASAHREADLGEALVAQAQGRTTHEAQAAFSRALTLDQNNVKAQFFSGLAAWQQGSQTEAKERWQALLNRDDIEPSWREAIAHALRNLDNEQTGATQ